MARCLIVLSVLVAATISTDAALAQGPFPAPLPGQGGTAGAGSLSASPLTGVTPVSTSECVKGFYPLRADAENRGKLIKAASERHAPPAETCKLIDGYAVAEARLIKYVEENSIACGIPAGFADQLKVAHKTTETLQTKVCSAAEVKNTRPTFEGPTWIDDRGDPAFGRRF